MITTFLFDLDDTLIDSKIYKEIYPVIVEKVCFDLKINQEELFSKAESFGLKKNKYGNFDSGDLCRKLNLLMTNALKLRLSDLFCFSAH